MLLKFHARSAGDLALLVNDPLRGARDNQPVHRIGRKFVPAVMGKDAAGNPITVTTASNPAVKEPYEIDTEKHPRAADQLVTLFRNDYRSGCPCLWPADEATAAYLDVPFVKTKFVDGEHVADVATAKPSGKKD